LRLGAAASARASLRRFFKGSAHRNRPPATMSGHKGAGLASGLLVACTEPEGRAVAPPLCAFVRNLGLPCVEQPSIAAEECCAHARRGQRRLQHAGSPPARSTHCSNPPASGGHGAATSLPPARPLVSGPAAGAVRHTALATPVCVPSACATLAHASAAAAQAWWRGAAADYGLCSVAFVAVPRLRLRRCSSRQRCRVQAARDPH